MVTILFNDSAILKANTIGTTGGIILFYLLGVLISVNSKIFVINSKKNIL